MSKRGDCSQVTARAGDACPDCGEDTHDRHTDPVRTRARRGIRRPAHRRGRRRRRRTACSTPSAIASMDDLLDDAVPASIREQLRTRSPAGRV